jgi:hypothetical protein
MGDGIVLSVDEARLLLRAIDFVRPAGEPPSDFYTRLQRETNISEKKSALGVLMALRDAVRRGEACSCCGR